jgi:two-component sensor histidine kinase
VSSPESGAPAPPETATRFDIALPPNLELIHIVREFIERLCARLLKDPDVSSQVAIAAHELIENAVKFSIEGSPELHLELELHHGTRLVTVSTVNRADPARLREIDGILREISEVNDANDYYRKLMVRSVARDDGSSGLGLGRILAESNMDITGSIDTDTDRVTIRARFAETESKEP